jgi:hypothetical protein
MSEAWAAPHLGDEVVDVRLEGLGVLDRADAPEAAARPTVRAVLGSANRKVVTSGVNTGHR